MGLLSLFLQPFMTLHLPPPSSFQSQTVLITGSNTGLGLETARHIVSLGASKVILGVRTVAKGQVAKTSIEASTARLGVVDVWELDLESFDSVMKFASKAKELPRLDVAIMNAGLASGEWNISPEGWERVLQVNVLSTSLLSLLLLPLLTATRQSYRDSTPHLVILGSDLHAEALFVERSAPNILSLLNSKAHWEQSKPPPAERYALTKLFDLYLAIELARLTPVVDGEPAVVVNSVAPGFCKSELLSREPGAPFILILLQWLTGRTVAEGAKTIVDASVRGKEAHGKYLDHQKIAMPSPIVTSEEGARLREKVWAEILEILRSISPEIRQVVKH